jgi:hypothetical protein
MDVYRKRSASLVATNSIQLNAKAMIFDAPTATTINLRVSILPHNLSKYFNEAGTNIKEARS